MRVEMLRVEMLRVERLRVEVEVERLKDES